MSCKMFDLVAVLGEAWTFGDKVLLFGVACARSLGAARSVGDQDGEVEDRVTRPFSV